MDRYLARDTKTYLFSCILLLQPQLRPRSLFPDVSNLVPKDCYHAQVPLQTEFQQSTENLAQEEAHNILWFF